MNIKELKKQLKQRRRISNTVFVITRSKAKNGREYLNYFVSRPNRFSKGQVIPKTYSEIVVDII